MEKKYLKYKRKYLKLKNQFGGTIKIRTRKELLQFLLDNKSLTSLEATKLEKQLKFIDEYIEGKIIKTSSEDTEENLLIQVAKVSLQVRKTRNILPRDNQLIAILLFLEGKNTLLQAGTGQGKSLIVAMVAILQQRLRRPNKAGDSRDMAVHVITTTDDLVASAISDNKALFEACNIRVRSINEPGYVNDVIYGTPFDFEAQSLKEASDPKLLRQLIDSRVRRTVILDESDSHLVDNASGRVLTSDIDPFANSVKDVLRKIAEQVLDFYSRFKDKFTNLEGIQVIKEIINEWVQKNHPRYVDRWNSEKDILIKNAFEVFSPSASNNYRDGVSFVLKKSLFNEIEDLKRDYPTLNLTSVVDSLESFLKNIPNKDTSFINLKTSLNTWSIQMKKIDESKSRYNRISELVEQIKSTTIEETRELIFTGAIQYLDVGTGQIISNMKFSDGIQEFLELKYFKQIFTEPTLSVRSYSLYRYVRETDLILGLSGTVGLDLETINFQRKVWQITRAPIVLPEFAISQLKNSKPLIHKDNQIEWLRAIYSEINEYSNVEKQPILIITENPEQAHKVQYDLMTRGLKPSIYEASTDKHILEEKLGPGRIIITTNLGGRGSDYQYDSVKSPKGLHVIIGFDSDEERILAQARGRAGRAGNPGSWQQISYGAKLQQKPKLENIKNSVKKTIGEDAIFQIYIFIKKLITKDKLNYLMSWLSNPIVRNNLLKKLTDKYTERVDDILGSYVLQTWLDYFNPTERFSKYASETRELTNLLKPHLSELYRLNL